MKGGKDWPGPMASLGFNIHVGVDFNRVAR